MPFQTPGVFEDEILSKGGQTRVIAPVGVTFKGTGLKDLGQEPRTKATIWGVEGPVIKFTVEGTGALSDPAAGSGGGDAAAGQPALSMILPKLYGLAGGSENLITQMAAVKWVLLSVFTMLSFGFAVLYRKSPTVEEDKKAPKNARGRS